MRNISNEAVFKGIHMQALGSRGFKENTFAAAHRFISVSMPVGEDQGLLQRFVVYPS